MSIDDKYKNYSAADIQKYLGGELSAPEMQALEAAALEDPFLADALEGMEKDRLLRGEAAFGEDMDGLKKELALRIKKKTRATVLPFHRSAWKAAAAVILLLGLGAVTYRYVLNGRSSPAPLASKEKKSAPAGTIAAGQPAAGGSQSDSIVMIVPEARQKDAPASAAKLPGRMDAPAKTSISRKRDLSDRDHPGATAVSPTLASSAEKAPLRANRFEAISRQSTLEQSQPQGVGMGSLPPDSIRKWKTDPYLVGKVTDDNDNPIPLITISVQGHGQAVRTDNNGLFHIQMLGSDSATHIMISSLGYQPVSLPADDLTIDAPANTIRLQPQSNALNEVAIGYATEKKSGKEKDLTANQADRTDQADRTGLPEKGSFLTPSSQRIIVEQAAPLNGWTAYRNYLEKNKKIPSIDSTRRGTEAISFVVSKKGKLSFFKIEGSLSPAHDSLLLHLIRHGAAWKPLYGNKAGATVILSY